MVRRCPSGGGAFFFLPFQASQMISNRPAQWRKTASGTQAFIYTSLRGRRLPGDAGPGSVPEHLHKERTPMRLHSHGNKLKIPRGTPTGLLKKGEIF